MDENSKRKFAVFSIVASAALIAKLQSPSMPAGWNGLNRRSQPPVPTAFDTMVLSPDGHSVLALGETPPRALQLVATDGSGSREILSDRLVEGAVWAPDGQSYYFRTKSSDNATDSGNQGAPTPIGSETADIERANLDSSDPIETLVTQPCMTGDLDCPSPSPDGKFLAYLDTRFVPGGKFIAQYKILNLTSQAIAVIRGYECVSFFGPARWSADSKSLYFRCEPRGSSGVTGRAKSVDFQSKWYRLLRCGDG